MSPEAITSFLHLLRQRMCFIQTITVVFLYRLTNTLLSSDNGCLLFIPKQQLFSFHSRQNYFFYSNRKKMLLIFFTETLVHCDIWTSEQLIQLTNTVVSSTETRASKKLKII